MTLPVYTYMHYLPYTVIRYRAFIFYGLGNKCQFWMYQSLQNEYLHSPNYPLNYSNNLRCEWMITAYEDHSITLQFHKFNVSKFINI